MALRDINWESEKPALWRLFRYLLLFAGCGWFVSILNVSAPAHAAPLTPSVKIFTFKDAHGEKMSVASWSEGDLRCTSVTSKIYGSSSGVSVSCVRL